MLKATIPLLVWNLVPSVSVEALLATRLLRSSRAHAKPHALVTRAKSVVLRIACHSSQPGVLQSMLNQVHQRLSVLSTILIVTRNQLLVVLYRVHRQPAPSSASNIVQTSAVHSDTSARNMRTNATVETHSVWAQMLQALMTAA